MTRKLNTLGLALVAALALTAVTASAAQANFTSSVFNPSLHGVQTESHKWTQGAGIGAMTCGTATFSGTGAGISNPTLTIKPTYGPTCTDSLGRVVHIIVHTLELHFLSTVDKGKVTLTGEMVLTVTGGGGHCTITTKGHQTLNGITYTQLGNDLLLTTHTNNIHSTIEGPAFICGTSTTTQTTGTYTGKTLLKGNGGAAVISVH